MFRKKMTRHDFHVVISPDAPVSQEKCQSYKIVSAVLLALILLIAFLSLFTMSINSESRPRDHTTVTRSRVTPSLHFLIVVTRHGNRAPVLNYPNNPYPPDDPKFWPNGPSQLTDRGRTQLLRLGTAFRSLYDGFLTDENLDDEVHAISTPTNRTRQSAEAFLEGLSLRRTPQTPPTIHTTLLDHSDYIGHDISKICPRFTELVEGLYVEYLRENEQIQTEIFNYHKSFSGLDRPEPYYLTDALGCTVREGYPLPTWAAKIYPEPISGLMAKIENIYTSGSDVVTRIFGGQLYKEMVDVMTAKADDSLTPDKKMYLYSAHDFTLKNLGAILGSRIGSVYTGSALVIELHRLPESTEHYVEVIYVDGETLLSDPEVLEPTQLNILGSGLQCPLKVLLSKTEKYYGIKDYKLECGLTN